MIFSSGQNFSLTIVSAFNLLCPCENRSGIMKCQVSAVGGILPASVSVPRSRPGPDTFPFPRSPACQPFQIKEPYHNRALLALPTFSRRPTRINPYCEFERSHRPSDSLFLDIRGRRESRKRAEKMNLPAKNLIKKGSGETPRIRFSVVETQNLAGTKL